MISPEPELQSGPYGACSKCGAQHSSIKRLRRGRPRWRSYCKACQNELNRAGRPRYADQSPERIRRERCRMRTRRLIKRGGIRREPCSVCGDNRTVPHHLSYNDPRDIVWVCSPCHEEIHHPTPPKVAK
jgi:hypothetical protein